MDGVRLLPPLEQRPAILQQRLTEGLPVLHFAFGSNLSLARLTSRVPGGCLGPPTHPPSRASTHGPPVHSRAAPPGGHCIVKPCSLSLLVLQGACGGALRACVLKGCSSVLFVGAAGGLTPLSVERAVVRNHRLAFNLRGLPPWEPSMASIEPCSSARSVTRAGQKLQHSVHGLLVALTHEDYDALYM